MRKNYYEGSRSRVFQCRNHWPKQKQVKQVQKAKPVYMPKQQTIVVSAKSFMQRSKPECMPLQRPKFMEAARKPKYEEKVMQKQEEEEDQANDFVLVDMPIHKTTEMPIHKATEMPIHKALNVQNCIVQ
jgi:hypothetical protein